MATKAEVSEAIVSPTGIIKFPAVNDPEINEQGKQVWSCSLVLDPKKDAGFLKMLEDEAKKVDKNAAVPHKPDIKKENGEKIETGMRLVSFKSYFKPKLIDAKMKEVDVPVTWGSKVRIGFTIVPYDLKGKKGITKYFQVVQIIDLNDANRDPRSMGFDVVNDGWDSENIFASTSANDLPWEKK